MDDNPWLRAGAAELDLAAVIEQAVTEKLERLEARRFGSTKNPRKVLQPAATPSSRHTPSSPRQMPTALLQVPSASRHIPAAVRRAVCERDNNRCRYVDAQGRRCTARDRLEFHHRHPFAYGGEHSVENVCLVCRTHNNLIAESDYGARRMQAGLSDARRRPRPNSVQTQLL